MFGLNRKKRFVELGPYPLEKLRRDASITGVEVAAPPKDPGPLASGDSAYLVDATIAHLNVYEELREPEPFAKKAPVPDDLSLRTRDIKGAGYFLDASQIGICEIAGGLWLTEPRESQSHAVVVLVEYSDPIDTDNNAAIWVAGNEHLLATLRAAEIALDLSGQISAMGFASCAHWMGASDIDLEKAAVLAGLAMREGDRVINPYLYGRRATSRDSLGRN